MSIIKSNAMKYKLISSWDDKHATPEEDWIEFEGKKIKYIKGVFHQPYSFAPTLPHEPGAYILYGKRIFYCGETNDINRRVVEGTRRMGRDTSFVCFSTSMLKNENNVHKKRFFKEIQDNCIPVLATAIHFLRLPLELENKQGVYLLSPETREKDENSVHALAEKIAMTALYHMGYPRWLYQIYLDKRLYHQTNTAACSLSDLIWDPIREDELARQNKRCASSRRNKFDLSLKCNEETPPLPEVWQVSARKTH